MSAQSGGSLDPPSPFNLYDKLYRGEMPTLEDSNNRNYKTLRHAFFTHPSDNEKYFIISGEEIRGLDIFDIHEGLQGISKEDFGTTTRLGSGDILVKTKNVHQINALKATKFFGSSKKPVTISENGVLNQSQAIIKCREIMKCEEERIISQLADQKVIGVQKLKMKQGGQWVNTPAHILTFSTPTTPAEVKIGYLTVKTEIYIPSPFRCVVCQRLGHTKKRCDSTKNKPRCGFCGLESPHEFQLPCYLPKCVNCFGQHPSFLKTCPRFIEEKEVNAIRVTLRIPYNLAREELRKRKGSRPLSEFLIPSGNPGPSKISLSKAITPVHTKDIAPTKKITNTQKQKVSHVNRTQNQSRVSKITQKAYKRSLSAERLEHSISKKYTDFTNTNTHTPETDIPINTIIHDTTPIHNSNQSIENYSHEKTNEQKSLSLNIETPISPPSPLSQPYPLSSIPLPLSPPIPIDPDPPDTIISDEEMPTHQNPTDQ